MPTTELVQTVLEYGGLPALLALLWHLDNRRLAKVVDRQTDAFLRLALERGPFPRRDAPPRGGRRS